MAFFAGLEQFSFSSISSCEKTEDEKLKKMKLNNVNTTVFIKITLTDILYL